MTPIIDRPKPYEIEPIKPSCEVCYGKPTESVEFTCDKCDFIFWKTYLCKVCRTMPTWMLLARIKLAAKSFAAHVGTCARQ